MFNITFWNSHSRLFLIELLVAVFLASTMSAEAHPMATTQNSSNQSFNLASKTAALQVSQQQVPGGSAVINVGQTKMTVLPGTFVTAGEYVALAQVLNGGKQSLVLDGAGRAVSGMFNLQGVAQAASSGLVIPHGVTVVDDFAGSGQVNFKGNLVNLGTFYAVSSNPATAVASISAFNIFNGTGSVLTSVLPASGISGVSNAVARLSLSLTSVQDIVNQGTIASAGNLSIYAGGSITNAGAACTPTMQAVGNVNLQTANLVNAGLIASQTGNINIGQQVLADLTIDNGGGTIQALNGQINVRDSSIGSAAFNTTLYKGDWLSKELNIFSGQGTVNIDVGQLSGVLNVSAGQLHVSAQSDNLKLGNICLAGDPTFFDTGSIELTSAMNLTTNGAPLAIIAGGDITVDPNETHGISIDTSSNSGGGDILLVAGAQFTTSDNSTSSVPNGDSSGIVVTITGASNSGGNIDLNGTAGPGVTTLTSSPSGASANAGYITLVAYNGYVSLPAGLTITAGGTGSGDNGTVKIIAGTPTGILGVAILMGNVNTTGGTGPNGGAIKIATATPLIASLQNSSEGVLYQPVSSLTVANGAVQGAFAFSTRTFATEITVSPDPNSTYLENGIFTGDGGNHGLSTIGLQPTTIITGALTSTGAVGTVVHAGRAYVASDTLSYVNHGFTNELVTEVRLEAPAVEIQGTSVDNAQLHIQSGDGGIIAHQAILAGEIDLDATSGVNGTGSISYYTMQTTGITHLDNSVTDNVRIVVGGTITSSHTNGSPICCDSVVVMRNNGDLGSANNPIRTSAQNSLIIDAPNGSAYVSNEGGTVHLSPGSNVSPSSNAVLSVDNASGDLIIGTPSIDTGILNIGPADPNNLPQSTVQLSVHGNGNIKTTTSIQSECFIAGGQIKLTAENGNIGDTPNLNVPSDQLVLRLGTIQIVPGSTLDVNTQKNAYITVVQPILLGAEIDFPDTQTSIRTVQIGAGSTFDYVSVAAHDVRITSDATHHVSVSKNSTISIVSPGTLQVSGPITFSGTFLSSDGAQVKLISTGNLKIDNVASGAINLAGSNTTVSLQSFTGKVVIGGDVNMLDGGAFNVTAATQIQVNANPTAGSMQFTTNGGANSLVFIAGTSIVTAVGNAGNGNNGSLTFTTSELFNVGQIWSQGGTGTITIQDAGHDLTLASTAGFQSFTALGGTTIAANGTDRIIFSATTQAQPTFTGPVQITDSNALITIGSNVTIVANNGITFTTSNFANYGQINSDGLASVLSPSGTGLIMSGNGGSFNSSAGTLIQAVDLGITFQGDHIFNGPVSINASAANGQVTVNPGVTIIDFEDSNADKRLTVFSSSGQNLIVDSANKTGILRSSGGVQISSDIGKQLTFQNGTETLDGPATISASGTGGSVAFNSGVTYTKTATVNSPTVVNKAKLVKANSSQAAAVFSTTGSAPSSNGAAIQIETPRLTNSGIVSVTDNSVQVISSLDLSDKPTVTLLRGLQATGVIGGSLGLNAQGLATGTLIFDTSNTLTVSAMNIPVGVTVTFKDFSSLTPVTVNLSDTSTSKQVVLNGTEQFLKVSLPGSVGQITVNSTVTPVAGPPPIVFTLGGKLTTDGAIGITVAGNMSINGSISAPNGNVTLTTSAGSNGNISITNNITANPSTGCVFLNSDGRITQSQSGSLISSGLLSITTGTGVAGFQTQPLRTSVVALQATSNSSGVFINNLKALQVLASSVPLGIFSVSNADAITVGGAVTAANVSLVTTAKSGIVLKDDVGQVGGFVLLNSFTTIAQVDVGSVQANWPHAIGLFVTLRAKGNIGQSLTAMEIDSNGSTDLISSTSNTGSAFIDCNNKLTLIQPFFGGTLNLTTNGDLVASAGIGASNVNLSANNGSVILGNGVGGPTSTVQIFADNDIKQTGTGAIVGGNVALFSNNGSIGSGNTSTINTQAAKTLSAVASTGLHIANNGVTTLGQIECDNGIAEVDANNKITTTATNLFHPETVSGSLGTILKTTANSGSIVIGSAVGATTAGTNTEITTQGTGMITSTVTKVGTGGVTGIVIGDNIVLTTSLGNIGSGTAALRTSGNSISANTTISTGSAGAYINNTAPAGVTLKASAVAGAYSLTNDGSITVAEALSTNSPVTTTAGSLSILETAPGNIDVLANVTANGGNVLIRKSDVAGNIDIGTGVVVSAGSTMAAGGNVSIVIGAVPATPTAGSPPSGVTPTLQNGGKVFFGSTGITANVVQGIDIKANARNIIFSNGGANASQITLEDQSSVRAKGTGFIAYHAEESDDSIIDTGACDLDDDYSVKDYRILSSSEISHHRENDPHTDGGGSGTQKLRAYP